jgi:O-antigen/teichoic acid export membrane protein
MTAEPHSDVASLSRYSPRAIVRLVRGAGRGGAVARTALTSLVMRGFSVVASLLTVPLVLHHVGRERYGIWIAAIALSTLFTAADGGVTKGLIAEVAKAHGAGDRTRIRVLVSSALAATLAFVAVFLLGVLATVRLVDWTWAFKLSSPALGGEAAAVIATICIGYALAFPATVYREARLGMLEGATVNLWDFAGLVAGFAGLVAAIAMGYGLVVIAAVWAGAPVLARTSCAIVYLAGPGRDLLPSWRAVEPSACRLLVAAGSVYILYTLAQALAVQSDQIFIARFLGAEAVTDYAVVQRLFSQPQVLVTLGLAAQWPAYAEALGRGDEAWIRRHLSRSVLAYGVFALAVGGVLAAFCNPILRIWVGGAVQAPTGLIVALAVNGVVATIASAFAFFFLSLGMHRRLLLGQAVMVAVTLPLLVLLIPRLGPPGAALAAALGALVAFVLPGLLFRDRIFADLPRIRAGSAGPTQP